MSNAQKHRFFNHLVQIGFKEIEVAYPAASEPDFNFVRELATGSDVPDDVWIQVSIWSYPHTEIWARADISISGSHSCESGFDHQDV